MANSSVKKYDLTKGGILDKLLMVSLPIMGTQLMQMAYNLTDMFWLGRGVDSDAVAASGTAGMYMWLSMGLVFIGRMGAEIGVAQSVGNGDEAAARRYAQNSFLLSVVLGVAFGALVVLGNQPLVGFFGIQEAQVRMDAQNYLAVAGLGIPFTFVTGSIGGAFNGSGNTRMPFFINVVGLVGNMILDPLLIITLNMGIVGAAVATSASQALVCLLFLLAVKKSRSRPFEQFSFRVRPDREVVGQILKWSIPIALENMLFTILAMIVARFVAAFGAPAMSVQRVGSQIESLSWLIGGGFASALTAFVGQNYGAGKWSRIHTGFRMSVWAIMAWGSVVTLLLLFAGGPLFSIFIVEPEIIEMGKVYLRILAVCQVASCLEAAGIGAFRGVGKTIPPSFVSITGNALRVPLCYVLSQTSLGLDGIWWGVTIGAMFRGLWVFVWCMLYYRRLPRKDVA